MGKFIKKLPVISQIYNRYKDILARLDSIENYIEEQKDVCDDMVFFLKQKSERLGEKWDVVIQWKQNDSGLYGRRIDMIAKELKSCEKIDKVIIFDLPINSDTLEQYAIEDNKYTHNKKIYNDTISKYNGKFLINGIPIFTYIYRGNNSDKYEYTALNRYGSYIKNVLDYMKIGNTNKILFLNYPINPWFFLLKKILNPDITISDIVDDQRQWSDSRGQTKEITHLYTKSVLNSDMVLTNCKEMYERVVSLVPQKKDSIYILPNACEEYDDTPVSKPWEIKILTGPVIGMVSTFEKKVDMNLLGYCARMRPNWNIVLIGSTATYPKILDLKKYSNIYFLGPIQYDEVKQYIKSFDVAIMAHRNIDYNKAMNPLKLFAYCSCGVPVVSTNVPNIAEMSSLIDIASSYEDFVNKIENNLNKKKTYSEKEKQIIEDNSWKKRVELIVNKLL